MDGMKVESKRSARSGEDAMRGNAKCVRCGMRETWQTSSLPFKAFKGRELGVGMGFTKSHARAPSPS